MTGAGDQGDQGDQGSDDAVAIVAVACRLPGSRTFAEYWDNLRAGRDCISRFTPEQLVAAGADPDLVRHPDYVPAHGTLPGGESFDWEYFGYSPAEAARIDPQQRVLLELASCAIDAAGIDPYRFPGWLGVFAGCDLAPLPGAAVRDLRVRMFGYEKDFLATRIAYKLGLRGPAVTVQTACSTALVAVHSAIQSLLSYECDAALAGGVSLWLPQTVGYQYEEGNVLSADGRCRPFDVRATGTVPSAGAGLVVLRRLADAWAERDRVIAIIRGSAINNDGSEKIGYTAPSVTGQREVIRFALARAGVDPADIGYVEAHGTGTRVGDPVEVAALTAAYREATDRTGYCRLGSVKGNLGHTGAAAGIAGLIKVAAILERRLTVPTLHVTEPNPELELPATPFQLSTTSSPWPAGRPELAAVSSFGMGGTNAHAVLSAAGDRARGAGRARPRVLPLSAASPAATGQLRTALADRLDPAQPSDAPDLADLAWTLAAGRRQHRYRLAWVVAETTEAVAALRAEQPPATAHPHPRVAFVFPGQGALGYPAGAAAYRLLPEFRDRVDEVVALLDPGSGAATQAAVCGPAGAERFRDTEIQQLALFVLGYGLGHQLRSWGVEPVAMLGHSIGEYVAATLAGLWSLPDALALVQARGRAMRDTEAGRMVAVTVPATADGRERLLERVAELAGSRPVSVAVDAPGQLVLAGAPEVVDSLGSRLQEAGYLTRSLATGHAFHTPAMRAAAPAVRRAVGSAPNHRPRSQFVSNLTGEWADPHQVRDAQYWVDQLTHPVRLRPGIGTLLGAGVEVVVELGPGGSMLRAVRQHPDWDGGQLAVSLLPARAPADEPAAERALLRGLAQLWCHGVPVDLAAVGTAEEEPYRCELPPHPLRQRDCELPGEPADTASPRQEPVAGGPPPDAGPPDGGGPAGYRWREVGTAGDAGYDTVTLLVDPPAAATDWARPLATALAGPGGEVREVALTDAGPAAAVGPVRCLLLVVAGETALDRLDELLDKADLAGDGPPEVAIAGRLDLFSTAAAPLARALVAWVGWREGNRPGRLLLIDVAAGDPPAGPPARRADAVAYASWGGRWWALTPGSLGPGDPIPTEPAAVTGPVTEGVPLAKALAARGTPVCAVLNPPDPDPVPPAARIAGQLPWQPPSRRLSARPDLQAGLTAYCAGLTAEVLRVAGELRPGTTRSIERLRRRFDAAGGGRSRMLEFLLSTAVAASILGRHGDRLTVPDDLPHRIAAALESRSGLDEVAGLCRLLAHCADGYPAVLRGEQDPLSVLRPDGDDGLLDRCLTANDLAVSDAEPCLAALGQVVRARHAAQPGRKLRVLEVGGGAGNFTWPLLAGWPERTGVEYLFTDVSRYLVDQARKRCASAGFTDVQCRTFDITRDPVAQELLTGSYDLVIGYNVVHVAPSIPAALANLIRLLRYDGWLCLVELTDAPAWIQLVWGLGPGWWNYDDELRADSIHLGPAAWQRALRDAGLGAPVAVPDPAGGQAAETASDHALLLAAPAGPGGPPARWFARELARQGGAGGGPVVLYPTGGGDPVPEPAAEPTAAEQVPSPAQPAGPAPAVVAGDPLATTVAAAWRDLLGVAPAGPDDDFFDRGGESLMAVHLMARIRETTGARVPVTEFVRGASFAGLVELVRAAGGRTAAGDDPAGGDATRDDPAGGDAARDDPAAPGRALPAAGARPVNLVTFEDRGAGTPLFLIGPAAGSTLCYHRLVRLLDRDRPCFGLESPGLHDGARPARTFEELAAHHVELVRQIRPQGPYQLAGWSVGAMVAHEMARQFEAAGQRVELLVGLDGYVVDTGGRPLGTRPGYLAQALGYYLQLRLPIPGLRRRLGQLAPPAGGSGGEVPDFGRVFAASLGGLLRYRPRPVGCRAVIFLAGAGGDRQVEAVRRRWLAPLYPAGVRAYAIRGSHWNVLRPPYVEQLAADLIKVLDSDQPGG